MFYQIVDVDGLPYLLFNDECADAELYHKYNNGQDGDRRASVTDL